MSSRGNDICPGVKTRGGNKVVIASSLAPNAPRPALISKKMALSSKAPSAAPNPSKMDTVDMRPTRNTLTRSGKRAAVTGGKRAKKKMAPAVALPEVDMEAGTQQLIQDISMQGVATASATAAGAASTGAVKTGREICDWRPRNSVCFAVYGPNLDTCNAPGCNTKFHHGCQAMWEYDHDAEADGCMKLCTVHHPHYSSIMQSAQGEMPAAVVKSTHASPAVSELTGAASTSVLAILPPLLPPLPGLPENAASLLEISTSDIVNDDNNDNKEDDDTDDEDKSSDIEEVIECSSVGDSDEEGPENQLLTLLEVDEHEDDGMDDESEDAGEQGTNLIVPLPGSPPGWFPPQPPPDFEYTPKYNAPDIDDIDNPGGWSLFSFIPRFDKKNEYVGHFTPTGAQVLPPNDEFTRSKNGWTFSYNGWMPDEFDLGTYVRKGATSENLKPLSRRGCLDVDVLKRHGLTANRVRSDPMFFFQMLFPLMSPGESNVEDDHRMPYFSNVAMLTNLYASSKSTGIGIGHDWLPCSVKDMVKWTAIPIRHGALEGSPGALKFRWAEKDARNDSAIMNCMTESRWLAIKRYFKLNLNFEEAQRGTEAYNPCAKFDYIFRCLVHNMNYCTAYADLDQTIDESTWGFAGYSGDAGGRLMNKPVKKGELGELIIVTNNI